MTILYNILRNFLVYFVPIVIIIFSISLTLPNASIHKQTLKNTDFYNKLSKEIKKLKENENTNSNNNSKTLAQNSAFSLFGSSISELTTPDWLENMITKNIDLTSDWLLEKQDEWTFYFPSGQVQTTLNQNLDKQTKELVNTKKSDIPECTNENLEKLKAGNFDLAKNFCLPKEVKDGTNNLSDFLPKVDINSLTNGLDLNASIDNFKAQNLGINSKTYEFFVGMRQYLTKIRTGSPYVLTGFVIILLLITILAKAIGRNVRKDLVNNLWKISLSTLSLSVVFILILGGLFMLNSWATNWILPGASVISLSDLLTWQWIWFLFDLVSIAIWSSFGMIILNLILLILPKGSTEKLNKHLQEKPQKRYENTDLPNSKNFIPKPNDSLSNTNTNYSKHPNKNSYQLDQKQPNNYNQEENNLENIQNNSDNSYQNKQNSSSSNSFQNTTAQDSSNLPKSFSNFDQEFKREIEHSSKPIPKVIPQISDIIRQEKGENSFETPTQIPRTRSIPPQNIGLSGHNLKNKNYQNMVNENLATDYPNLNSQTLEQIYESKTNSDNLHIETNNPESKSQQSIQSQNQSKIELKSESQNSYLEKNQQNFQKKYPAENQKTEVQENPYSDKFYPKKEDIQNTVPNRKNLSKNGNSFVLVENEIDNDYDFEINEPSVGTRNDLTNR